METRNSLIMELVTKVPGAILQVNAGELSEFAAQIVNGVIDAFTSLHKKKIENELLTINEVSDILKVSKMTLHRWDKEGILSKIVIGGKRRYRRLDVEAIIENPKKTKR